MLAKRTLVSLVLLPFGLAAIILGGTVFATVVALILGLAAWEYTQLYRAGGFQPAGVFVIGGAVLLTLARAWNGFESAPWIISLLILSSLTYHLVAYERGRDPAGTDFGLTLAGALYLGWIGAYLVSLRFMPDGKWWMLLALPAVWAVDSGAFLIGHRFGRHHLSRRISPHKTWEGYLGGILFGTLAGALLAWLYGLLGAGAAISPARGALLGFILATLTLLGDLGESMFKRQVGAKDSGSLLPGHGGVFDRIDSWLWAAVIGYYAVLWLFP
ncbi:MAG TPA: CDP-archaeol synthase [Anaerolineales bacterium]